MKVDRGRIAALRAVLAETTPGPWTARMAGVCSPGRIATAVVAEVPGGVRVFGANWVSPGDPEFIARCRQDVPWLLDLVEALAGEAEP